MLKKQFEKTDLNDYNFDGENFFALGDRIIVEFINQQEEKVGNIIVAKANSNRPTKAVIRAISENIDKEKYKFEVGDVVTFGESAYTAATSGGDVKLFGKKLHILNVTSIFGYYKATENNE